MDRPSRKRDEIVVAPTEASFPRGAANGVYATGAREASARLHAPAHEWPDWTDAVRYTVARAWPESRPGGDA
jgi:hypothetical protein